MKPAEEKDILYRLQQPDTREEAFTLVVQQHQERLYWHIRRMVLTHEDADDILQNTFIKAWRGLDSFRGEAKIATWLYRIATNECLNHLERRRTTLSIDAPEVDVVNTLHSDPYFDGDETQMRLQEAISHLPHKQRAVFDLKYFEEMTYEEISQVFGTSIGSLKASYHHATRKIIDFFESQN